MSLTHKSALSWHQHLELYSNFAYDEVERQGNSGLFAQSVTIATTLKDGKYSLRQPTLSDNGFEKFRKKTHKEQFLDEMEVIISWKDMTQAY